MLQGPFASTDSKRRFEREIELVGSLHHPNIAKIFDSGIAANGQLYFAMQYKTDLAIAVGTARRET